LVRNPKSAGIREYNNTVEDLVIKSGVREGLCLVNAMHITAAVFINDDESGLLHDYELWLESWRRMNRLVTIITIEPGRITRCPFKAADNGPRNRRCHNEGQVRLWSMGANLLREFDGRRRKRVLVKIIGE